MTMLALPWKTLRDDVDLAVDEIVVDGIKKAVAATDRESRSISLGDYVEGDWETLELSVSGSLPSDAETRLERPRDQMSIHVVLAASSAYLRTGVAAVPAGELGFEALLTIRRDEIIGRGELIAVVVGEVNGVAHRELGQSREWTIDFDPPRETIGKAPFKVTWVEFDAPEADPMLAPNNGSPFYFDLAGDEPVLYLNKSIEYMNELLDWEKAQSLKRSARDLLSDAIATKVLTQIAFAALDELDSNEDGTITLQTDSKVLAAMLEQLAEQLPSVGSLDELKQRAFTADTPEATRALRSEVAASIEVMCGTRATAKRASEQAMAHG